MDFLTALEKVYRSSRKKEQLDDPLIAYSRLSDLIGNSYEDKKKAELFFKVSKKVNLFMLARENGEEGQQLLYDEYDAVSDIMSQSAFLKLVDSVYAIVYQKPKRTASPAAKKKTPGQAKITHKEETETQETRTPLNAPSFSPSFYSSPDNTKLYVLLAIIAFLVIVPGTTVAVLCTPWSIGQWILGAASSVTLLALLWLLIYWLDDEIICDFYISGTFILFAAAIANFVLELLLPGYPDGIFYCMSGATLVGGVILAGITYDDTEYGWCIAQVVATVLNCISFVLILLRDVTQIM